MTPGKGTAASPRYSGVPIGAPHASGGEKKFQEIFQLVRATRNGVCPVRDIITRVSDKWSILVIYALGGYGTLRFSELKQKIGDISQRMLTVTLRHLEEDGLLTRAIYAEVPPRVEYTLTPLGESLLQQLAQLADWANAHSSAIVRERKKRKEA